MNNADMLQQYVDADTTDLGFYCKTVLEFYDAVAYTKLPTETLVCAIEEEIVRVLMHYKEHAEIKKRTTTVETSTEYLVWDL